jgi:hypothetical protein
LRTSQRTWATPWRDPEHRRVRPLVRERARARCPCNAPDHHVAVEQKGSLGGHQCVGVLNCPGPFLGGSGKLFLHVDPVDSLLLGLRRPLLRRELLLDRGLADRCGLLLPPLCYGSGSRSSDGNGTNLSSGGNCRSCRWSGGWSSGGWTDGGWEEYCRRLLLCLLFQYFYLKYTGYMGIWCLSNTLKSPQIFFPKNTIP